MLSQMTSRCLGLFLFSGLALAHPSRTLDQKLAQQWSRFTRAQDRTLEKVGRRGERVRRDDWESLLRVVPPFSPEEIRELRLRQESVAGEGQARALAASAIDLEKLRHQSPSPIARFCAELPKGGMLHVHPWGTLSRPGLVRILDGANPMLHARRLRDDLALPGPQGSLYPRELSLLEGLAKRYGPNGHYLDLKPNERISLQDLFFLDQGTHPFNRFEAGFTLMVRLLVDNPGFDSESIMFDDLLSRARAERVSYLELSDPTVTKKLAGLGPRAEAFAKRYGVTVRWLDSFVRLSPPEALLVQTKALLALPASPWLVGVNLVADETGAPALETAQEIYLPLLLAAHRHQTRLHRTIHAGELGDPRNPRDAILLGAERLGHGVQLKDDVVTLEYARLHHLPVEVSLTSNLRLKAVASLHEHPFLHFLRLGLKVSLSTDDEGILGTDINHECEIAVRSTDMNYFELRTMALNSLDTAFADPPTLAPLRRQLESDLSAFEKRWK